MFCSSVELQCQPAPAAISTQLPPQYRALLANGQTAFSPRFSS
ncbi:MAG: hypothetical protein ACKO0N_15420 [Planctomycetota bacterium]